MKKECTKIVETSDSLGIPLYFPCGNPAKFKVEYIDSVTGKNKTDVVCGIHYNSIKKWAKRVHKIFDFDAQLKATPIG